MRREPGPPLQSPAKPNQHLAPLPVKLHPRVSTRETSLHSITAMTTQD